MVLFVPLQAVALKTEVCRVLRLCFVSQASLGKQQAIEASCAKRCYHQTIALLPELDTTLESC